LKKRIFYYFNLLLFILGFSISVQSQETITPEGYIEQYKDIAIRKMKEYGIPASITLAQGILESGSGNSRLAREANNHFGIKCHKEWTGKTIYVDDD
jgi:flagellum-specific peptidoglycan hydrolase FlgJ